MIDLDDFFSKLNDENEALMVLSALGFVASDWPAIERLGGAEALLRSDLGVKTTKKFLSTFAATVAIFKELRPRLDSFFAEHGALLNPLTFAHLPLFKLSNAPLTFFSRFEHSLIEKVPAVAIVGSRAACEQGQINSLRLGSALAAQGFIVISGGAQGIDEAAHRGALKGGGNTVLVTGIACSLKRDELYERIAANYRQKMAVLYPFGPFFPQGKYMFVERNRFVVALADALIVVQGQKGSGTLHTVKFAQKLGKPIFAIPGDIKSSLSWVPNALIASGEARAIIDFSQDFHSLLKGAPIKVQKKVFDQSPSRIVPKQNLVDMPELLRVFLENGRAMTMPELINKTRRSFLELQKELLSYELSGQIVKRGPQFVLTDN